MAVTEDLRPRSIEAEEAVLGALLIDGAAIHRVEPLLRSRDFYRESYGWVYAVMLSLSRNGQPIDLLTVTDLLEKRNQLKGVGGAAGLINLGNTVPTSVHAEHYARIVANNSLRRRLIAASTEIAKVAYDQQSGDPLADAYSALMDVAGDVNLGGLRPISEAAAEFYDHVETWVNNPLPYGGVRGLSTGMPTVDGVTDGLPRGELVIIAGRPSMGKSALGFEIGRRVAEKKKVALFSLEMNRAGILERWAAAIAQVDPRRVRRGVCPEKARNTYIAKKYISEDEAGRYIRAIAELNQLPVHIDDTAGLTADDIRARSLALVNKEGPLDLVVVDHCGLMRADRVAGENGARTEGRKSQRMKELAKELGCSVILLVQLSRAVEARTNKRPIMADLRDSGEHEQNADIILGLYRDGYYTKAEPGSRKDLEMEVLLLKHRSAPAGDSCPVRYERELSRFTEWVDYA